MNFGRSICVGLLAVTVACSSSGTHGVSRGAGGNTSAGGSTSVGGDTSASAGGSSALGGTNPGTTGGAQAVQTGGTVGTGGNPTLLIDAASPTAGACRKVDLVISLDGSGSMSEELKAMSTDVFPKLAGALLGIASGLDDFRVGVIDACPMPSNFHTRGATTADCGFSSGQVWMESTSPRLVQEFSCVGDLYTADAQCRKANTDEQPVSAAITALNDPVNAGFVRTDAVLVVMAITDEDEQRFTFPTAQAMFDALVAVKGNPQAVVLLTVAGSRPCTGVYGGATEAVVLKELTALFQASARGVFWDLCAGRLEDGLSTAMSTIETACIELPQIL